MYAAASPAISVKPRGESKLSLAAIAIAIAAIVNPASPPMIRLCATLREAYREDAGSRSWFGCEFAVARAGGLLDTRADPRGVYLFRYETLDVARKLGILSEDDPYKPGSMVPLIYRLDLTQAGSFFMAERFEMRDRDILYVASATGNQVMKFLNLLGAVTQPVIQTLIIDRALQ